MEKYIPPEFHNTYFTCPYCDVLTTQSFTQIHKNEKYYKGTTNKEIYIPAISCSQCHYCDQKALWVGAELAYPIVEKAPLPAADMPEAVKNIYNEARAISSLSSKGAAALLRLAVQHLMPELNAKGDGLNKQIKHLVENGLPVMIQQSLDSLRVTGNHAVHPGLIDFDDDEKMATSLFNLLNIIVESQITQPAQVKSLFESLPKKDLENIKQRDGKQD